MHFEFSTATKIIFGAESLKKAAPIAADCGNTALIVTGDSRKRSMPLLELLKQHGVNCRIFSITAEPTVEMVEMGRRAAAENGCDMVIAMGGGSVIDGGKAIAACMANPGDIYDYLEVVGKGRPLTNAPVPFIAIPTTAGTGAEVTANAVLQSAPHCVKVSLRSAMMLPRAAIVDPLLSLSLPPALTAATGMDALTQLIEAFVSLNSNPMTDALCREGIRRAAGSLLTAYEQKKHIDARTDMALAALFSGLVLANAKLGAVHGIAGPLGGMLQIPHGVICARLLPLVMQANVKALKTRQPHALALKRFKEVAVLLTGSKAAEAKDGIAWLEEICFRMKIPSLSRFGVTANIISELTQKARKASSMKGNPVELTDDELEGVIITAC